MGYIMLLDTTILSRLMFAFTVSFHIIFPAFSIGLALFLAVMEGVWLKTKNPLYKRICKFWTKIFALTFGMGVVSGVIMEFQFGTNWGGFSHAVGGVLGGLFTYEVMTAFFIEAGFLGVMLFGWDKVSPKMHYAATLLVAIGTNFSAFWIMVANTWMQHPVGYIENNGIFTAASWSDIILNLSNFVRLFHMLLGAYICGSFVIASVSAYYILKNRHEMFAKTCFKFVWLVLFILIPLQIFMGDASGENVLATQPIKTAAMEGVWDTQKGAPFVAFAWPDMQQEKNLWSIDIPHAAAMINTHKWDGKLIGLKSVPNSDRPYVPIVFFSFRAMVYIGFLMLGLCLLTFYLKFKDKLFHYDWYLWTNVLFAPLGFIAVWSGWVTAEAGRQPWAVYGLLRTADASSKVPAYDVFVSLLLIIIVYGIIFGYFYLKFLNKIIKKGPSDTKMDETGQPFQYMPIARPEGENK